MTLQSSSPESDIYMVTPRAARRPLDSGLGATQVSLLSLAVAVPVIAAVATCDSLVSLFDLDPKLPCVLVSDGLPGGRMGIVSRAAFHAVMAGRLGFGWSMYARKPVTLVADWSPLMVGASTTVEVAASMVLSRVVDDRYPDTVVADDAGSLLVIPATTLLRALSDEYGRQARYDTLTGLPNRLLFVDELTQACRTAAPGTLALFFADLDGFKAVNDNHGHGVGDRVLRETAQRLRDAARPSDLVARLAGDEFTLLVINDGGGSTTELAGRIANRLIRAVAEPIEVGATITPHISVGVAVGGDNVDADLLLREADQAMYRAKLRGGFQAVIADDLDSDVGAHA